MSHRLQFTVDKLTGSIKRRQDGERFIIRIVPASIAEIRKIHKKDGWKFNWKKEFKEQGHDIYKLSLQEDDSIQGLISLEPKPDDRYIEMHLIENAPHNRRNDRDFIGVASNLVAFVCCKSFEMGFDGVVAFTAKTKLIDHYIKTFGAQVISRQNRMAIFTTAARNLVASHYPNFFNDGYGTILRI